MKRLTLILAAVLVAGVAVAAKPDKKRNPTGPRPGPRMAQRQTDLRIDPQAQRLRKQRADLSVREAQLELEERETELRFRQQKMKLQLEEMQLRNETRRQALKTRKVEPVKKAGPGVGRPGKRHAWQRHHKFFGCIVATGFWVTSFIVNLLVAIWIYADIRKRNRGSGVWIVLGLLTGLLGALVYAVVRVGDRQQT